MDIRRIPDKVISGSVWKQVLFTAGITLLVFGFFVVVSFFLVSDKRIKVGSATVHTENPDSLRCNIFNNQLQGHGNNRYWGMITQFLDPGNVDKADKEYHLFITLLTLAGSATLGGLFIATLSNALERRVDKIKNGEVRYRLKGHAIIAGYDPYAITIIKNTLRKTKKATVVLFTSRNPVDVKKHLSTHLDEKEEGRVVLYHGGRDSFEQMRQLDLFHASSIFILGEPEDPERDSMNLHCFKLLRDVLSHTNKKRTKQLVCHVLLQQYKEYQLAQQFDLHFRPLNFHEEWSRTLLSDFSHCIVSPETAEAKPFILVPSEQLGVGSTKHMHLIIMGFEEIGKVFAAHAMRVLHFPNLSTTKITFIDPNAAEEYELFSSYFPGIDSIYDIACTCLEATPFSNETRSFLEKSLSDENELPCIIICSQTPERSLAAGMNLPLNVYLNGVPVVIHYNEYYGISDLVRQTTSVQEPNRYGQVRFWGMNNTLLCDDGTLSLREAFAESAHTAYLHTAKQLGFYNKQNESNQEYHQLNSVYQWTNRYLADGYVIKLRSAGLYVADPETGYDSTKYQAVTSFEDSLLDQLAQSEHARWVAERVLNGWTYGERRDNVYKIHPNIAPWEQIDDPIRQYDYALIHNLIQSLKEKGYTVVRAISK
ncbi:MAG: RyR domain-containing protein [Pelodictyon phaeoclathratiforme]